MTNVEVLQREIRAQRNRLYNAIVNRREHPTYGYTKKGILSDLSMLEGMLLAYHIVVNGDDRLGSPLVLIRRASEDLLGENIDTIRKRAETA